MNAHAPLRITVLDNCWENVHPDVAYVVQEFAGYPYWMVFTPYPLENARFENPTIRASHDGVHWEKVSGITDPLVQPPATPELHHADPELVYNSGRLHVIYLTIRRESDEVTFNAMSCGDDLRWSEPQVFHQDTGAVSPTFHIDGNVWHEWFIRTNPLSGSSGSKLVHREGSSLLSLENECECQLKIPKHVPWHVDVLKVNGGYEALIAAYPDGTDSSRTRLFHVFSKNGLNFNLTGSGPIIKPSKFGWDNRTIYRSTFLKEADGKYRIWYSGVSWGHHSGIGLVEGSLHSLDEPPAAVAPVPSFLCRVHEDLAGRLRYELRHHLPRPLLSLALHYLERRVQGQDLSSRSAER
jgi:hypothetical protein